MIISHKHKFIFIKTRKTAGTSVEGYLSKLCGSEDVITPINPPIKGHLPQNYKGYFPFYKELLESNSKKDRLITWGDFKSKKKYYNHIPAWRVKLRVGNKIWNTYHKFTIERNPFEKSISHYWMLRGRLGIDISFDDYLKNYELCFNYPLYTNLHGDIIVDRILTHENLSNDLRETFDFLGLPFDENNLTYEKANHRQNREHYTKFLSENQILTLEKSFDREIKLLDNWKNK